MIELQKVKRDVINYGALKVYTTFLTLSEDEVDPELFAASQLKEIFEKRFDVIKVDMSFVEGEEATVVAKELLVFKLSKCSDEEISYMSNIDDEGKLSSLVLTKSSEEISLEVVEYSVGGEEVPNVEEAPSGTIAEALGLDTNGKVVKGSLPSGGGTKLYLHTMVIEDTSNVSRTISVISTSETKLLTVNTNFQTFINNSIKAFTGNNLIYEATLDMSGIVVSSLVSTNDGVGKQQFVFAPAKTINDTVTEL